MTVKPVFYAGHITPIRGPEDQPLDVTELDEPLLTRWDDYWLETVKQFLAAVKERIPSATKRALYLIPLQTTG